MTDALRTPLLRRHAGKLRAARRAGVELACVQRPEHSFDVGCSRIGGRPDLPVDTRWPCAARSIGGRELELPLAFLAQISLSEVARHDTEGILPRDGLLSLFALDEVRVLREAGWSDGEIGAPDRTRVMFFPASTQLVRCDAPATLPPKYTMATSKPKFRRVDTWPQGEGTVIGRPGECPPGGIALDDEAWSYWAEHAPPSPPNLLLGHPAGCEFPIGSAPDSRLLLSLEAGTSGLPWDVFGRNGFLFVRMPEAALAARAWHEASHKEW